MEAKDVVKEALEEIKGRDEAYFKREIKDRVQRILSLNAEIQDKQKELKKEQEELKALKLEHADHAALFS